MSDDTPQRRAVRPSIQGSYADHYGKVAKTYEAGRVCKTRGCRTRLSIYNPDAHCALHQVPATPRVPPNAQTDRNRRIVELYGRGFSTEQIATMYGISKSRVWSILWHDKRGAA